MRRLTVIVAILVTSACGADPIVGDPSPRPENHYRDRVLDQLDLPLPQFVNWEVVDATERPDPPAQFEELGNPRQDDCAPDGDLATAAWRALDIGERWSAARGTGPGGEVFDVAVTPNRTGSADDVATFIQRCGTTEFDDGTVVTLTPLPNLLGADYGFGARFAKPDGRVTTVSYIAAQPESLRLVLTYRVPGDQNVGELWERAYRRFTEPR